LDSFESTKVISPVQYLVDTTLIFGTDASFNYVFSISSSVPSEQEGIPLSSSMIPITPKMDLFDWNDLVEPRLPSSAPFQIMFRVNSIGVHHCIIDEEASVCILSSSAWKSLGSLELVSATNELLDFNRRPSECLGILP